MRRRDALAGLTGAAIGVAGLSKTASAATQPRFLGLVQGANFAPSVGGTSDPAEATRVDLNKNDLIGEIRGAVRYPDERNTDVTFLGFDSQAPIDVAEFEFTRGSLISTSRQTVSFKAQFDYGGIGSLKELSVDLKGATPV